MTKSGNSTEPASPLGRRRFLALMTAAALLGPCSGAHAQGRRRRRRRRALKRFRKRPPHIKKHAREAMRRGEIRPLRDVFAAVRARSDAEILDVDLHETRRGWVYALRVLTAKGHIRDVFLNARTLEVLHFTNNKGGDGVPLPPELAHEPPLEPPGWRGPRPELPEPAPPPPPGRARRERKPFDDDDIDNTEP